MIVRVLGVVLRPEENRTRFFVVDDNAREFLFWVCGIWPAVRVGSEIVLSKRWAWWFEGTDPRVMKRSGYAYVMGER